MMFASLPAAYRRLAAATPALALALLAGCDTSGTGSYPTDLAYPGRTDPIVVEAPGEERFYADQPGTVEQLVRQIGVPKDKGGLGGKAINPAEVAADKRRELTDELKKVFGSPAAPTVAVGDDEKAKGFADELKLDTTTLAEGSKLYRRHCLTCHGVPGDGRGPTGPWVNPHPRDYRLGAFKFISVNPDKITNDRARKPRRADLIHTLTLGIDGTTMPSFSLLTADQLEQVVSYVIHLSVRGEVELDTLRQLAQNPDELEADAGGAPSIAAHVAARTGKFLEYWAKSNASPMRPTDYPYADDNETQRLASVTRGYEIFTNSSLDAHPKLVTGAGCISCHQDFGRQVNFKYDQWGTLVRPANLTSGVYRGGRSPVDLYWRVRGGIIPSQMPKVPNLVETVKREELNLKAGEPYDPYWDLVNFLAALPYPEMLPKAVRERVYPPTEAPAEAQHAAR